MSKNKIFTLIFGSIFGGVLWLIWIFAGRNLPNILESIVNYLVAFPTIFLWTTKQPPSDFLSLVFLSGYFSFLFFLFRILTESIMKNKVLIFLSFLLFVISTHYFSFLYSEAVFENAKAKGWTFNKE